MIKKLIASAVLASALAFAPVMARAAEAMPPAKSHHVVHHRHHVIHHRHHVIHHHRHHVVHHHHIVHHAKVKT
jgi:hypothetical protein